MLYEINSKELYQKLSEKSEFTTLLEHDLYALKSPTNHPAFNIAVGSVSPETIASAQAFFHKTPFCFLINADNQSAESLLISSGFTPLAALPEMILDLLNYHPTKQRDTILIEPVHSEEQLIEWCKLETELFDMPFEVLYAYNEPILQLGTPHAVLYLGSYNQEPVATAMVHVGSKTLCISSITVKQKFQRNGIGTAMTHACLNTPRPSSVEQAILLSYGQARTLYEKIGFELTRYVRAFISSQ